MFRIMQVARYVAALQSHYGIEPARLLKNTGIDPKALSSPDTLISLDQYAAVVSNVHRFANDPAVAFNIGKSMKLSDFGLVGYAMLSAQTLRDATDVWIRYGNSLVGQYVQTSWGDSDNGHELSFLSVVDTGMLHRFETELAIVGGMIVVQDLTGTKPVFDSIDFTYPQPPHVSLYKKIMKCKLRFDAPKTVVRITEPAFDTPVKTTNPDLFALCAENCSNVMTLLPNASDLLFQLRTLFLSNPSQLPDLDDASKKLGMSASTLLRRLEQAGYSYQRIKDEFRFDLCREYLRSGHMAPKKVAYLLGFSSPSNFRRAFKAWSGVTVTDFLQSAGIEKNMM
jgi:AraC-like DNA-binding protein